MWVKCAFSIIMMMMLMGKRAYESDRGRCYDADDYGYNDRWMGSCIYGISISIEIYLDSALSECILLSYYAY